MKDEYKFSELGFIPVNWEVLPLSKFTDEITDYVAAGSFEALRENVSVYDSQNYAVYVRLTDLRKGLNKAERFVDEKSYNFLRKSNLYGREILIANIGANVGEVFLMPTIEAKATIAPNMIIIRAHNGKVDPIYLYSYLASEIGRGQIKRIIAGSGHPKLNKTDLRQLLAILPPLSEQQKIASILSTVDEKIAIIDAQISQTQELKKGLMQQLLSKGIGHTKFKSSELGDIPENWEVVKLGDVTDVSGGKRLPKGKNLIAEVTRHPYIRVADMFMGGVRLKNILHVPNEVFPEISRYTIKAGDLFISVAGTLGIVGIVPKELDGANLTENANKISNIKIDRNFLYFLMTSSIVQDLIKKEQTNNAQPKLALTRIREFKIPVASKDEQIRIGSILATVDNKLQSLQSRKETYQQLKKGLMQQLLTGKIRVNTCQNEPALA